MATEKTAAKKKASAKPTKTLEQTLWDAADKLRGNLEASEYKHVVLGLVFYSLLFSFFKEVNKEYQRFNEDAHFVSCKLSMAATHGAILVLLYN